MNIVAYAVRTRDDVIRLENSTGMVYETTQDLGWLLDLLYTSFPENDTLKVFWDMDASIAPVLRLLGERRCKKLHETNKCYVAPYSIYYMPSKVFSIRHVSHPRRSDFYDLQQYFPDAEEPGNVKRIADMGKSLLMALHSMQLYPTKLSSPIAIYEQCVLDHVNLPTAWDIQKEAAEMAWYAGGKTWTEAYQIGCWGKAFDYDLRSAFPMIARELLDLRNCQWVHSADRPSGVAYGYVDCLVTIHGNVRVSPIIYADDEGNLSTPTGVWRTHLTDKEISFIAKWQIGEVDIIEGWWAITGKVTKPLWAVMNRLLAYKDSEDELVRMLAKRMSVGVYGKMGEEWSDQFGPHFNPVWFSEISTQARLKVAEFIYVNKLQEHLLHVSVDGVLVDREVQL